MVADKGVILRDYITRDFQSSASDSRSKFTASVILKPGLDMFMLKPQPQFPHAPLLVARVLPHMTALAHVPHQTTWCILH